MTEPSPIGARARIPNPALKPLEFLLGSWRTSGTHPDFPGEPLRGRTLWSWHEGGAFLLMRSEVDREGFPDGVAIVASDDVAGRLALIWFDERGTSRIFEGTLGDRSVTWRRDHPEFSQTMTIAAGGDRDTLVGTGRMAKEGAAWSDDLSQIYVREET